MAVTIASGRGHIGPQDAGTGSSAVRRPMIQPRWPAAALALLVGAGAVKSSSVMRWLPVDLTLLSAIVVLLGVLNIVAGAATYRWRLPLGWVAGAVAFGALGFFSRTSTGYASDKTLSLCTLTLGCSFVAGLLLVRSARQRNALAWGTVAVGLLVAALARIAPATDEALYGLVALSETATLTPARVVGAATVVVLAFAIGGRLRLLVAMPLAAVLLVVLVGTGSRGPLVGLVAAGAGLLLFLPAGRRLRALLVLAVVAAVVARIVTGAAASVQDRFLLLLADDKGASVNVREALWRTSWEAIQLDPFGRGWGGLSPALTPVSDYPHNILLEVAGEGGVIAVAGLLFVVVLAIWRTVHAVRTGDASALAIFALVVFWFVNALVSGDINDNRGLFVVLAAALAVEMRSIADMAQQTSHPTGRRTRVWD